MPGSVGRLATISRAATPIIGIRTMSVEGSFGSINITSGEDSGKQTLLAASSEESITITFEGVAKDEVIRDLLFGSQTRLYTDLEVEFDNGDTLTGDLRFSSYSESFPYNDARTFSATLESSGDWTYTQA